MQYHRIAYNVLRKFAPRMSKVAKKRSRLLLVVAFIEFEDAAAGAPCNQQERAVSQRRSSFSASSRSAGMLIVTRTINDEILSLSEGDGISMLCSEQRACPNSRLDSEMGIYSTGESKQNCVTTNDKREKRTLHVGIRLVRDDRLRCVGNQ